ncbi:hypothetical protein VQ7734_05137 [Vibrio quintilis]|uniref:Uncharacterized protein n=1 Tax=Vibrio quintilis TaxID=1117707 RepID=A0A1M7Z3E8_9VIBR|nr:hypothetical protein VQ7734_05137 [Vibrio quintilis]
MMALYYLNNIYYQIEILFQNHDVNLYCINLHVQKNKMRNILDLRINIFKLYFYILKSERRVISINKNKL